MSTSSLELPTRVAHWGWDDHRFLGHAAFADLTGRDSFTALLALAATGRRPSAEAVGVLDDIAGAITMADPRIWPLKLARLVSAYGAAAPGVAAGMLISEHAQVGPSMCKPTAEWLHDLCERLGPAIEDPAAVQRAVDERLATARFLWGFGTPCRPRDERLSALRVCIERRGRQRMKYWCAMESVVAAARTRKDVAPNIISGIAAACLDVGFTPNEIGLLIATLVQHCFVANASESAAQQTTILQTLPTNRVRYVGVPARTSPRGRP